MPPRKRPLTPWGKEVKHAMLNLDITPKELVASLRARGLLITDAKLSAMLSGQVGQRSPEMVAAVEELLDIPPAVAGRPA